MVFQRGPSWFIVVMRRSSVVQCDSLWFLVGHGGSSWLSVVPRGSSRVFVGAPRGSLWVLVAQRGVLVGPRGSAWVRAGPRRVPRLVLVGPRGSSWVPVGFSWVLVVGLLCLLWLLMFVVLLWLWLLLLPFADGGAAGERCC